MPIIVIALVILAYIHLFKTIAVDVNEKIKESEIDLQLKVKNFKLDIKK